MIKLPDINFQSKLSILVYNYSKPNLQHRIPLDKKCPLQKDKEYWVPEPYRIVELNGKQLIQYGPDGFDDKLKINKKFLGIDWESQDNMEKELSRFSITVNKIEEKKLIKINKTEAILESVSQSMIPITSHEIKNLETNIPIELARFKHRWIEQYGEETWDKDTKVWNIHYTLNRLTPSYPKYDDQTLSLL